jgi:hypothetical protein
MRFLIERGRPQESKEKASLVRADLEALISREAGKRLAALDGTQPRLGDVFRRRSALWANRTHPAAS